MTFDEFITPPSPDWKPTRRPMEELGAELAARLGQSGRVVTRGSTPLAGRPRRPIDHGTAAGHQAHRYRNEDPCDECRRAAAQYAAEYKARRRQGERP